MTPSPKTRLHTLTDLCGAAERRSANGTPAAIGAFNIWFYSQAVGILKGLQRAKAPAILQSTQGPMAFFDGAPALTNIVLTAMKESNHTMPVCLHHDHGKDETARNCIDGGFSSVMIDASSLPFDENIETTRKIVEYAHSKGVSVEGEYGKLEGVEDNIVHESTTYADPDKVPEFFKKSGCDALAIAYGTSHGANKGSNVNALKTSIVAESYQGLVAANMEKDHFLVGHGSSTVPRELVDEINKYGGELGSTNGIPIEKIKEGISLGLRKINIDTDLLLGITATVRKYLAENEDAIKAYPETLGKIKKGFDGEIPITVWGNPRDPKTITDPRGFFGMIDINILQSPPTEKDGMIELMSLIEERVANHVEMLVNEFGSAGLAADIS